MSEEPQKSTNIKNRKRLLFLSLGIFALFAALIAQMYKIQIIEEKRWSKEANKQHYFIVKEPFKRGTFISNPTLKKGHPETPQSFVIDVQKYHLYADPESIPVHHKPAIADYLATILELNPQQKTKLLQNLKRKSRSRRLDMWLDKDTQKAILNWWNPFSRSHKIPRNAIFFVSDYQRSYPYGKLLGQVLHTIQAVKDEKTSQAVPTGGLELSLNPYLKGKIGKRRLMRSPRNSLEIGEVISVPEHGANIHLTINHCLQAIAEEEIAKGVQKSKAKSGWAVMMNPYTGEILALAQYPFFAPSDYQRYFNDSNLIEHTKVKAITDANEPGSIMKPFTMVAALKANDELAKRGASPLFDPEAIVPTSNPHFPGRRKPLKDTSFHAFLNMQMALQKSSNIYVARLAEKIVERLGNDWYRKVLQDDFGFGQKTGIELPSESWGVLPTPGKKHPNGALEWSQATPYSLAMGHNIQVTSLQMLRAFAILANRGYLVKPTLIRKIIKTHADGTEEVLVDNTHRSVEDFPRVVSQKTAEWIATTLKYCTKIGGTAKRADIWGYTEAGKTGTGDKAINGVYQPKYVCSSFVGFSPVKSPAFVLVVSIDEPEYGFEPGLGRKHHGGICAAPVFREIGKRTLEYLGIAPDDPYGYPAGDPRHHPDKADWLPEIRQLKEKYEKWNGGHHK